MQRDYIELGEENHEERFFTRDYHEETGSRESNPENNRRIQDLFERQALDDDTLIRGLSLYRGTHTGELISTKEMVIGLRMLKKLGINPNDFCDGNYRELGSRQLYRVFRAVESMLVRQANRRGLDYLDETAA